MTKGRDTSDRKSGLCANESSVRFLDRRAEQGTGPRKVHLIATRCQKQQRLVAVTPAQHHGFHDLIDRDPDRIGGIFGTAGRCGHAANLGRDPEVLQMALHAFQAFAHGVYSSQSPSVGKPVDLPL